MILDREKIKVCNFTVDKYEIYVKKLTDRQRDYIKIIENYKYKNKKTPTIRDICKLVNSNSPGTVQMMMKRLKNKGYNFRNVNYKERGDK